MERNDADIDEGTESSYTLTDAEVGKTIKVKVTFIDDEGTSETLTSAQTTTVAAAPTTMNIGGGSGTEEENSSIVFTVTLGKAATATVTVDYATADGTGAAGDDYTSKSGTLSSARGRPARRSRWRSQTTTRTRARKHSR